MILLGYIGDKREESFLARVSASVILWAQRGYSDPARRVTHTELLLGGDAQHASIASASIVDGGVRVRHGVVLNPKHWLAIDVPDTETRNIPAARTWFALHDGQPYDKRGAAGSVGQALLAHGSGAWFCSEANAAAMGLRDPHMYPPAGLVNLVLELGARDVTAEFFATPDPKDPNA